MEQAVSKVGTITSKRGVIASGDQFISKQEQRDRIKKIISVLLPLKWREQVSDTFVI